MGPRRVQRVVQIAEHVFLPQVVQQPRAADRGELVLAGALANPIDGAVFFFSGSSPEVAERFGVEQRQLRADPPHVGRRLVRRRLAAVFE